MTGWIWRWLCEPLWLIVFVLLSMPTPTNPRNDLYAPAIAITALDVVFKVGNSAWRAVFDLASVALPDFGLYPLVAAIRWPLERAWENRRHPSQDAEDGPTLRQMMQPELMPDVGTRTDEHGDRRMRIEPCLQPFVAKSILALRLAGVRHEARPMLGSPMDCVLCAIAGGREPVHGPFEDERFIIPLNVSPLRPVHALIVVREHAPYLSDLSAAARDALPALTKRTGCALRRAGFDVEGINPLLNDSVAVSQHVAHLHLHLAPRRRDDLPRLLWHALTRFLSIGCASLQARLQREGELLRTTLFRKV